jgi:guanylate kinase
MNERLILFCGPSGSGKTSLVHSLLKKHSQFAFSVSATTRPKRDTETEGRDYIFLSEEQFRKKIDDGEFLEWEEVYPGRYYGTMKSTIEQFLKENRTVVFDVDVKGGLSIKKHFGAKLLDIFVMPPSVKALRERLVLRASETKESLEKRLAKSALEMSHADQFSYIIVNDDFNKAVRETELLVEDFLKTGVV